MANSYDRQLNYTIATNGLPKSVGATSETCCEWQSLSISVTFIIPITTPDPESYYLAVIFLPILPFSDELMGRTFTVF